MKKQLTLCLSLVLVACAAQPVAAAEPSKKQYMLEVDWGSDVQVIEFVPKGAKNKYCVIAKNAYGVGITCFDKR